MADDQIRYDVLVQEALRGVVRKVLSEVARTGLPGDHHFFIAFDTRAPGVRISSRLRERYPEEMTIVIQHQYRDLVVTETTLEVGLSFSGVPERLLVPFSAIKGLFDPSVKFGLEFEVAHEQDAETDNMKPTAVVPIGLADTPPSSLSVRSEAVSSRTGAKQNPPVGKRPVSPEGADPAASPDDKATEEARSASVVSLDKFRKKP